MGPTNEPKKFMMTYFFGYDVYPANKIDRQENPATVKQCLDEEYLYLDDNDGFPLYKITEKGRNYLK